MGYSGFKEYWVDPKLGVEQGLVAVHLNEEVDASVTLVKMRVLAGESLWATWAEECPPRCNLQIKYWDIDIFLII